MPAVISCPDCQRKLRVPDDLLGKNVKCPDCKATFTAAVYREPNGEEEKSASTSKRSQGVSTSRSDAPVSSPRAASRRRAAEEDEDYPRPPADDEEEDEGVERRPGRQSKRAGWQKVRLGLNLYIYAIYVVLATIVLTLIGFLVVIALGTASLTSLLSALSSGGAPGGAPGGPPAGGTSPGGMATTFGPAGLLGAGMGVGIILVALVYILGLLVNFVLRVTGHVFFLYTPEKRGTGSRPLALTTVSLFGAELVLYFSGLGLSCMGNLIGVNPRGGGPAPFLGMSGSCMSLFSSLCALAWFFVFLFYLRAIATAMQERKLAGTILAHIITWPIFVVVAFAIGLTVVCLGGAAAASFASSSSSTNSGAAGFGVWGVAVIIVGALIALIYLGLLIWWFVILHQVRGSVSRYLAG